MSDLATPTASRLTRPSLRDSRLIVGVLLVLASTVLGAVLFARAGQTVPMYAARGQLVPGQALTAADLVRVDVHLGDTGPAYLSAKEPLGADLWVLREVRPGELIPASGVGARSAITVQPVTLLVDPTSAAGLTMGSVVDVYVNRPAAKGAGAGGPDLAGPERSLAGVTVGRVEEAARVGVASTSPRSVQVLVPMEAVKGLVADVDLGAKITLVLVPGSVTKAPS